MVNNSGKTITAVYFRAGKKGDWGPDCLSGVLKNNQSTKFVFPPTATTRIYSIWIFFQGQTGGARTWDNIDLYKTSKITVKGDGKGNYTATYE